MVYLKEECLNMTPANKYIVDMYKYNGADHCLIRTGLFSIFI